MLKVMLCFLLINHTSPVVDDIKILETKPGTVVCDVSYLC